MSHSFYTTREAAKILNVDITTIANWVDNKKLDTFITPGGHRRIGSRALYEFLRKSRLPIPSELAGKFEDKIKLLIYIENEKDLIVTRDFIDLELPEYSVDSVSRQEDFNGKIGRNNYDLILIDQKLRGTTGLKRIIECRKNGLNTPMILITGQDDENIAKAVIDAGGQDYIVNHNNLSSLKLRLGSFKIKYISDINLKRQSEEMYRNFFENSPLGTSMTGIDGTIRVNKAFCEMLGHSEEELKGKNWKDITYPDDTQKTTDILELLLDEKIMKADFEKRYIHKNGSIVYTVVNTCIQRDGDGKPQYYITSVIDITEKKKALEALQEKNLAFDASLAANSITGADEIITQANNSFLRIWGYTDLKEVIGKPVPSFFKNKKEAANIISSLNEFDKWEGNFIGVKKDGSTFLAYGLATVLRNKSGVLIGYQSSVLDVTEQKKVLI